MLKWLVWKNINLTFWSNYFFVLENHHVICFWVRRFWNFDKNCRVDANFYIAESFFIQIHDQEARKTEFHRIHLMLKTFFVEYTPLLPLKKIERISFSAKKSSAYLKKPYTYYQIFVVGTSSLGPKTWKVWRVCVGLKTNVFRIRNK